MTDAIFSVEWKAGALTVHGSNEKQARESVLTFLRINADKLLIVKTVGPKPE